MIPNIVVFTDERGKGFGGGKKEESNKCKEKKKKKESKLPLSAFLFYKTVL